MVNKKTHVAIWSFIVFLMLFYLYAILTESDFIGDITAPPLMLIFTGCLFYGYVMKQNISSLKLFGWLITIALLAWAICDTWWGIQTIFLHQDPNDNFLTVYGYALTNILFLIGMMLAGYKDFIKMNKLQALFDTAIFIICSGTLLWLFVFQKDTTSIQMLLEDPISFLCVLIDLVLYAWISVWTFSTRQVQPPFYRKIFVFGGLLFVIVDLIYYYQILFTEYDPNSWLDGGYILAFFFLSVSAFQKVFGKSVKTEKRKNAKRTYRLGFEWSVLLVPLVVFIYRRSEVEYFIFLIVVILIYYMLVNISQKVAFQEKLLLLEKNNVADLEKMVEERTQEVTTLMNTDYISGLFNRRYFDTELQNKLVNLKHEEVIAVLYVDQNKSKAIKHLYGIEFSEKLIRILSAQFMTLAKEYQGIVASYSDDVFVFMISGKEADYYAELLAKDIINRCEEVFNVEENTIRVTVNIGIACFPRDTIKGENLVKNADIAMTQARTAGYNRIQFYSEKIGDLSYNRHMIELKLKKVAYDKEFMLFYQPQVYCDTGKLCGFETLIRWYEGGKNFLSPLEFIPLAEETGVIIPLGYWILEQAACQYAIWKDKTGKDFKIAVNISVKQLIEADFVKNLKKIINMYHVNPEFFEVEITESQQIENNINVQRILKDIREIGVAIAIDDFGTGYSSLYYLKNLPIDRIKIAKELVDNIENELDSIAIVQMVMTIAKAKHIKVIAEGVETEEQWNCLKELGCDEIQGYYFSKPLPLNEVEEKWIVSSIAQ